MASISTAFHQVCQPGSHKLRLLTPRNTASKDTQLEKQLYFPEDTDKGALKSHTLGKAERVAAISTIDKEAESVSRREN